jgi:hypothetical protein
MSRLQVSQVGCCSCYYCSCPGGVTETCLLNSSGADPIQPNNETKFEARKS